ncbi:uncharacterized protein [Leptinotarsa decemlineata]|uniref:uncharacterized protein n=1 Tax=Leptinotarsa decemlineata TaxID=7539 RepID=UPI003D306D2F
MRGSDMIDLLSLATSGTFMDRVNLNILESLQGAILSAVEVIPDGGPQVQFQSCVFRLGWLQVVCENQVIADWLASVVNTLQPWESASLKCVTGD